MRTVVELPAHRAPMALLGAGIPLTLLLDLAGPARPGSREIARSEGGEADWLLAYRRLTASAAPRP